MPCCTTIYHSPPKKTFVCIKCNRKFWSRAGCTQHTNIKHSGQLANLVEANDSSKVENSSYPGLLSLVHAPSSDTFNNNNLNFNNNDIPQAPPLSPSQDILQVSPLSPLQDILHAPPLSPSQDILHAPLLPLQDMLHAPPLLPLQDIPPAPSLSPLQDTMFTEYHPYLNGKINNICFLDMFNAYL